MKSVVRPELPTASVGSSQAPTAAVDNSAPLLITAESTYKSGKSVQTTGATSREVNAIRAGRISSLQMMVLEDSPPPCSSLTDRQYCAYNVRQAVRTLYVAPRHWK